MNLITLKKIPGIHPVSHCPRFLSPDCLSPGIRSRSPTTSIQKPVICWYDVESPNERTGISHGSITLCIMHRNADIRLPDPKILKYFARMTRSVEILWSFVVTAEKSPEATGSHLELALDSHWTCIHTCILPTHLQAYTCPRVDFELLS